MKKNLRKWIIGATLILACVESVVLWQRNAGEHNKPTTYKRYVSRPLPDGTRYTLLYPARVTMQTSVHHDTPAMSFKEDAQDVDTCDDISVKFSPTNTEVQEGENSLTHSIRRHDADSKRNFFVEHNNCIEDVNLFESEDKVIIGSFKILPPSAPVPSP